VPSGSWTIRSGGGADQERWISNIATAGLDPGGASGVGIEDAGHLQRREKTSPAIPVEVKAP
jgi:hypothetical protein